MSGDYIKLDEIGISDAATYGIIREFEAKNLC